MKSCSVNVVFMKEMRNGIVVSMLIWLCSTNLNAQKAFEESKIFSSCNFYSTTPPNLNSDYILLEGNNEYYDFIELITSLTGLRMKFDVYSREGMRGAEAFNILDRDSVRLIGYIAVDREHFDILNETEESTWGWKTIVTHEVAHHLLRHTLNSENNHGEELEADELTGYILTRLTVPEDEILKAYGSTGLYATETHPEKRKRVESVRNGIKRMLREKLTFFSQDPFTAVQFNGNRDLAIIKVIDGLDKGKLFKFKKTNKYDDDYSNLDYVPDSRSNSTFLNIKYLNIPECNSELIFKNSSGSTVLKCYK